MIGKFAVAYVAVFENITLFSENSKMFCGGQYVTVDYGVVAGGRKLGGQGGQNYRKILCILILTEIGLLLPPSHPQCCKYELYSLHLEYHDPQLQLLSQTR